MVITVEPGCYFIPLLIKPALEVRVCSTSAARLQYFQGIKGDQSLLYPRSAMPALEVGAAVALPGSSTFTGYGVTDFSAETACSPDGAGFRVYGLGFGFGF